MYPAVVLVLDYLYLSFAGISDTILLLKKIFRSIDYCMKNVNIVLFFTFTSTIVLLVHYLFVSV